MYPSNLPCPRLASAQSQTPLNFNVTYFDYGSKRRTLPSTAYTHAWSTVYTKAELEMFRTWYISISYGEDSFDADWSYEGRTGTNTWRFISPYEVVSIGADNYAITAQIEIII